MATTVKVWQIAGVVTAVKLLLIPSYRSTDFEVHRNWLAITHSKPVKEWYFEKTSEWTLDYPPLFAWFEYLLSQVAFHFDPKMLIISKEPYLSHATIIFQRLSVIIADFLYIYAVKEYCIHCLPQGGKPGQHVQRYTTLLILLLSNFGLMIVDHIHFQYNGFLFGILLLSLVRMCQHRTLEASFWFAALLNFKHIYLYIAPAYFMYLLRNYCFIRSKQYPKPSFWSFSPLRFFSLGVVVISVFVLSFGPFISMGQLPQVLSRLFPFKRGLCHAYWAPNIWALYNVADKAITVAGNRLGLVPATNISASMTGGLVQEFQHTTLPSVTPLVTLVCTLLSMMPNLVSLWRFPEGPKGLIRSVVLCAFGSFLFGWHVHEKAILLVIIPLTLLAVETRRDAEVFLLLSTCGHFSLFPLIFTPTEAPIKYCMMGLFTILAFHYIGKTYQHNRSLMGVPLLSTLESLYLFLLLPLQVYCSVIHAHLGLNSKLPFLPLLLTSVYTSIGVVYSWLKFYYISFTVAKGHSKTD